MKRVDEVNRGNASVVVAAFFAFTVAFLTGMISLWIFSLDIVMYLQPEKFVEILLIVPTVIMVFLIHELIHVGFFIGFGEGEAKIKVSREKSVGAIVMHQVNEKVFYSRVEMTIILLSPLAVLTILLLIGSIWISMPYLIWINIVLNALGSGIDLYVTWRMWRVRSKDVFVNFESDRISMNVYVGEMATTS